MCEVDLNSPEWNKIRVMENMKHTLYKLGLAHASDVSKVTVEYEEYMDTIREHNMDKAYVFVDILMRLGLANALDRARIHLRAGDGLRYD